MRADARRRADGETPCGFWRIFASRAVQLVSALMVCACALIWPAIAWAVTGRVDAYTATETAWRSSHLALFEPWLKQGSVANGSYCLFLRSISSSGSEKTISPTAMRIQQLIRDDMILDNR